MGCLRIVLVFAIPIFAPLISESLAVKSLNLQCDPEHLNDVSDENDPIEIAIKSLKIILAL